jgi:adenylate kinase family enzyme
MIEHLERVVVVGSSCSGKSTFARALSRQLGHALIDLDELHWGPNWTPKAESDFRRLADAAARNRYWVAAGNYNIVRDLVWPRATGVIWLNYSFPIVFGRALRRTLHRVWHREELFSGNRESLSGTFLSRDSILLWVITSFRRRRKEFATLRSTAAYPHLHWIECRRPCDVDQLLTRLSELTTNPSFNTDALSARLDPRRGSRAP